MQPLSVELATLLAAMPTTIATMSYQKGGMHILGIETHCFSRERMHNKAIEPVSVFNFYPKTDLCAISHIAYACKTPLKNVEHINNVPNCSIAFSAKLNNIEHHMLENGTCHSTHFSS
jgi:hypothetical protein